MRVPACVWFACRLYKSGVRCLARRRLFWGGSGSMSGVNTRATKRDSDRDVRESQHSSTPHPFASTDSAQLSLGATGSSSPLNISQGLPQLQPPVSSSSHHAGIGLGGMESSLVQPPASLFDASPPFNSGVAFASTTSPGNPFDAVGSVAAGAAPDATLRRASPPRLASPPPLPPPPPPQQQRANHHQSPGPPLEDAAALQQVADARAHVAQRRTSSI